MFLENIYFFSELFQDFLKQAVEKNFQVFDFTFAQFPDYLFTDVGLLDDYAVGEYYHVAS